MYLAVTNWLSLVVLTRTSPRGCSKRTGKVSVSFKPNTALSKPATLAITKWGFSGTLPIFFILFLFPEMTIYYLFGEGFDASASPLRILSAGYIFYVLFGTNATLLITVGKSRALHTNSSQDRSASITLSQRAISGVRITQS